jgi:hypothetical protein
MENTMKSLSIIAEMIPKNNPRFFIKRITSLLITFYMSYLFFHFVVLNEFTINNTLVIVVNIWAGHIFLNISTLGVMKNRTFGDLLVKVEYQGFRRNIDQIYQIAMRSIITATLFYIVAFCNYLAGFSLYAMITSLILAIVLNCHNITINHTKLSVINWVTGTLALKSQKNGFGHVLSKFSRKAN